MNKNQAVAFGSLLLIVLFFLGSSSLSNLFSQNSSQKLAAADASTILPAVKILPLGDSITYSSATTGAYRTPLWNYFVTNNLNIDFVGSLSSGPSNLPDKDNEGHTGWRIEQISGATDYALATYQPDIVLLLAGTNDILQSYNVASAPDRLSALIDKITFALPNTKIIVSTLPPQSNSALNANVQAFNAQLPGMVASKVAAGKNVLMVDMYSALTIADLADGVHPNFTGYDKMAAVWYSSIATVLQNFVVLPAAPVLMANQSQQFAAKQLNSTVVPVTWSLSQGVGTIDSNGLYTAPATLGGKQKISVKATSEADPTKSYSVVLTLLGPDANWAAFNSTDTTTQGNWKGIYGGDGYYIPNAGQSIPTYATLNFISGSTYTWANNITDVRALQIPTSNSRIASSFGGTIDIRINDGKTHQVGLYALDFDRGNRQEKVDVIDPDTNELLDSKVISSFNNGIYYKWNVSGHVQIKITFLAGYSTAMSGIFFGGSITPPPPPPPPPPPTSTTTPPSTPPSTPLAISNVYISNIYANTAMVNWTTNIPADSQVDIGNQSSYGFFSALDTTATTTHAVKVTNLSAGTTYHVRARSKANGVLALSSDYTFLANANPAPAVPPPSTPPPPPPPPTSTKFKTGDIVQTTDNLNVRSSASATGNLLGTQILNALGTILSGGLSVDGLFWWNVNYDLGVDGWSVEDYLKIYVATPPPPPPPPPSTTSLAISNVSITNIYANTALINWTTNIPADTQVDIGNNSNYGYKSALDTTLVTTHSSMVTSLSAGTKYSVRARSRDALGNLVLSPNFTFTASNAPAPAQTTPPPPPPPTSTSTPPPPATAAAIISNVSITNIYANTAMVNWTTNIPTDGQVDIGNNSSYGFLSGLDSTLSTNHSIKVTNLSPGTKYHVRARSKNASGILSLSTDYIFTASSAPAP